MFRWFFIIIKSNRTNIYGVQVIIICTANIPGWDNAHLRPCSRGQGANERPNCGNDQTCVTRGENSWPFHCTMLFLFACRHCVFLYFIR